MIFSERAIASLRRSLEQGEPVGGPLDLQILPTTRCNAGCAFCPLHAVDDAAKAAHAPRWAVTDAELPGGLLDRLFDDLYHLGGLERVHITGGEPLLYRYLLPLLFGLRQSFPAVETTVVTNGILLEKFAPVLVKMGLARLSVSLNAGSAESYRAVNPTAGKDDFAAIGRGLRAVNEHRAGRGKPPFLSVTAVLTNAIAAEARPLFELCRETGADSLTFIPLMELRFEGRAANQGLALDAPAFQAFQRELAALQPEAQAAGMWVGFGGDPAFGGLLRHPEGYAKNPCYAGYSFTMVWPNGDVRPCCNCEELMGNLTRHSIGEIWRSANYRAYRKRLLNLAAEGPPPLCACAECGYAYENRAFREALHG